MSFRTARATQRNCVSKKDRQTDRQTDRQKERKKGRKEENNNKAPSLPPTNDPKILPYDLVTLF